MLKTKRNLEKIESFAERSEMMQPPILINNEDLKSWYSLLEKALAKKSSAHPKQNDLQPQPDDKSKSEGRRELEQMLSQIVARNSYTDIDGKKKNRLTVPVLPLLMVYNEPPLPEPETKQTNLRDMIRSLQQRLK
jgi:hypothetical protein